MRRRTALIACTAAIVVGSAGAVAIPLIWGASRHHVTAVAPVGTGAATRLAAETPAPVASPSAAARPSPTVRHRTPVPHSSSHGRSTHSATSTLGGRPGPIGRGPGPVSVAAPSVGIRAAVYPVGVDAAGEVAIPERVDTVGWYRFGARPGSAQGSTVLVGHVDSAVQGAGAFFRLQEIKRGARIALTLPSGRTAAYHVVAREAFRKGSVPLDALFSLTGAPRLTMITCGGSFDPRARSYRDNVVVTAVPI